MNIYQDESGCLGFNKGSSEYFVVTLLCPSNSKYLTNVVRKFKGKLIRDGWPKQIEIKAHNLFVARTNPRIPQSYRYKNNPLVPIHDFLKLIGSLPIEIDAIVINKKAVNQNLRTLPYGVLFNYFSAQILTDRICKYDDVCLFVDQTSKQTHDKQHFDGYISTNAKVTKGKDFKLQIEHGDSRIVHGLGAADFTSWAIFRSYEQNDQQFETIIQSKILVYKKFFFK